MKPRSSKSRPKVYFGPTRLSSSTPTARTAVLTLLRRWVARIVQVPFKGFGDLRNRAIDAGRCDWIFGLDADERYTAQVRNEYRQGESRISVAVCLFLPPSEHSLYCYVSSRHSSPSTPLQPNLWKEMDAVRCGT